MKKYKLKKDFPGSKIGDVWVKPDNGFMSPDGRETIKMHEHLFKPFNDWFEDYEEPKKYWFIDAFGNIVQNEITKHYGDEYTDMTDAYESQKLIGNHFGTPEEAEKAVEKLKALVVLNKFGFRFIDWELDMKTVADGKIWFDIGINTKWNAEQILKLKPEIKKSLDALFGGKE